MKKFIFILTMLLCVLCISAKDRKEYLKTVTFNVSMHCSSCQKKIEGTIGWDKGVKRLTTDLKEKTVTITYDTRKTSEPILQKSIEKLGYNVTVKKTDNRK